jgi:hypothetical protein
MIAVTGKVLRILPLRTVTVEGYPQKVAELILADACQYWRVSLWDEHVNFVLSGTLQPGETLRIENASPAQPEAGGEKRLNAGSRARITDRIDLDGPEMLEDGSGHVIDFSLERIGECMARDLRRSPASYSPGSRGSGLLHSR